MTGWQRIAEVGYPPTPGDYFIFDEPCRGESYAIMVAWFWRNSNGEGFDNGAEHLSATHWMAVVYPEPPESTP